MMLVAPVLGHGGAKAATPVRLKDLSTPGTVPGGNSVEIVITLDGRAPAAGVAVRLSSSSEALAVPSRITVKSGATSERTVVTTDPVSVRTKAVVTATYGSRVKSETVVITPITVKSLDAPAIMEANSIATLTVRLSTSAPVGGITVHLNANRPSVLTVPSSITVPAGSFSAFVMMTSARHSNDALVSITARLENGSKLSRALTVAGIGQPTPTHTAEQTQTTEPTETIEPTGTVVPTETLVPTEIATGTVEATETPEAQVGGPVSFILVHADDDWATFQVCMADAPASAVSVPLSWLSTDDNPILIFPGTLSMSAATPCTVIDFFTSSELSLDAVTVTITATVGSTVYSSEPIHFAALPE